MSLNQIFPALTVVLLGGLFLWLIGRGLRCRAAPPGPHHRRWSLYVCRNPRCGRIEPTRPAMYCPKCGGPVARQQRMALLVPPRTQPCLLRRILAGIDQLMHRLR